MLPSMCSPERYCHNRKTGSCLVLEDVRAIAQLYVRHQAGPTAMAPLVSALHALQRDASPDLSPVNHLAALLAGLRRAVGPEHAEHEWLDMPFISQHASEELKARLYKAFRPPHPAEWLHNPRMWLSSLDIESVLRQYERRTPSFVFLGVFPIDFAVRLPTATCGSKRTCVSPIMCDMDIQSLCRERRCSQIGAVFNMDKHTQGGSHWVAFHAGVDPSHPSSYGASYYDSVARAPPRQIRAFMTRVKRQVLKMVGPAQGNPGLEFEVRQNTVRKQFKNTECGVFAIYFIAQSILRRKSFNQICQSAGRDEDMNALRKVLFRTPTSPKVPPVLQT